MLVIKNANVIFTDKIRNATVLCDNGKIVDIVESGRTLKENGLDVLETIFEASARMIVNRVSMKIKRERIKAIIENIKEQLKENENL